MPKRKREETISERSRDVLRELIREHIKTGEPVGSRKLAKLTRETLSPATIRNVVSDLEELGLVTQPHTSAGRIPTEKGYRFYVESLLENRVLPVKELERIRQSLEQETDPGELMAKTSQILSAVSDNVGFVLAPPMNLAVMRHIEFVEISDHRILVILVTRGGLVQHKLIQTGEKFSQQDLHEAARYLVENFEGRTLHEIREDLIRLMTEEKALYDRLLRNVVVLGSASLAESGQTSSSSEVYLGGAARLIHKPELADVNQMITLFETFEQKSRLVKILSECLKVDCERPTVTIGLEKHLPGMQDWALISSPYSYDDHIAGSLGILGPSRMEYEKAISLVDYVAKLFGKILSRN